MLVARPYGGAARPIRSVGCGAPCRSRGDRLVQYLTQRSVPADVLLRRIDERTTNPYGKTAEERELVLRHLDEVEPLLRATCTHEIDATHPVDVVVRQLIEIAA